MVNSNQHPGSSDFHSSSSARIVRRACSGALALLLAAGAVAVTGCDDLEKAATEGSTAAMAWQGVIEQRAEGNVEWKMSPDGKFVARVTDKKGAKVPPSEVEGTVKVEGGEEKKLEKKDEDLSTALPPPKEDVTELEYALTVRGEVWKGMLHVPKGGSEALVAKPSVKIEPGTRGPNGGIVEVVNDQRIELLIDEETDDVRAYFLDGNMKPTAVGDAKMTIALLESPTSHLKVKLAPAPDGDYLVGKASKKVDAAQRITVVLEQKGKHHARIVGMGAARVVHAGKGAPTKIRVTLPEQAEADDKEVVPASAEEGAVDATGEVKAEVDDATKGVDGKVKAETKGGAKVKPPKVDLPSTPKGKAKGKAGVEVNLP